MQATVAREDMTLDLVLWRAFGRHEDALVAATLALNPGLAAEGPILPVGRVIDLPEAQAAPSTTPIVRLWG